MKNLIKALDELPFIIKLILCIPALDIVWCVSRVCRSYLKQNTLGMIDAFKESGNVGFWVTQNNLYTLGTSADGTAIKVWGIYNALDSIGHWSGSTIHLSASGTIHGGGGFTFASGGFPDTGSLFVARESGPEMVCKMKLCASSDTESRTADVESIGIIPSVLVTCMYHHSSGESFDEFLVLS